MKYCDTVLIATVTTDGYGDSTATSLTEVPAIFIDRKGLIHDTFSEGLTSTATVYLSPTNSFVLANKENLNSMYIVVSPFSDGDWYRIVGVTIAKKKLLTNAIDNIHCTLEKVAGIAYANIS